MKPFDLVPTAADFSRALTDFDDLVAAQPTEKRNCWFYTALFGAAKQAAEDVGDLGLTVANDIFNSLCFGALAGDSAQPLGEDVAALRRNYENGRESFDGILSADGSPPARWVHPVVRLRWAHYDALQALYPTIRDADLRARVADLLWLVRRDFRAANEAVSAYVISSQLRESVDWVGGVGPLQRALRIERALNRRNGPALQRTESALQSYSSGDLTHHSSFLMRTMLALNIGNAALCGTLAEAAAQAAENEIDPDWHRAENYWDLAVQWHSKARNQTAKEAALWALARCYEKHSDFVFSRPGQYMPHSHAADWLEHAVETLRGIGTPDAKTAAEKLYVRLVALQSRIMGEMPIFYHPIDLSEMVVAAQQRVTGHPLMDALGTLAHIHNPASARSICRDSYAIARQTVFVSRTAQRQLSPTGGTAARNTLLTPDEKLRKRERRRVRMIQHAHLNQALSAQGAILPALQTINNEHRINTRAILPLLQDCIFVLKGHDPLFSRGLVEGARGDWVLSSHLLVPQIEAGFRALLVWLGATPPDDVKNGKREWGMQEFLLDDDCCARLRPVFGEALLYDARVLLVEKFGANLRPSLAHGLLPQGVSGSPYVFYMVYTWWLALRLCFATLQFQASLPGPTDESSESGGDASA